MKLVLIEWIDSHSASGRWNRLEDIKETAVPLRCKSVGWLVKEGNGCKVIVPHLSGCDQQVVPYGSGDLTIPNGNILKMTVLLKK